MDIHVDSKYSQVWILNKGRIQVLKNTEELQTAVRIPTVK